MIFRVGEPSMNIRCQVRRLFLMIREWTVFRVIFNSIVRGVLRSVIDLDDTLEIASNRSYSQIRRAQRNSRRHHEAISPLRAWASHRAKNQSVVDRNCLAGVPSIDAGAGLS